MNENISQSISDDTNKTNSPFIYLAAPHNDINRDIADARFKATTLMLLNLVKEGNIVYSPISHSHQASLMDTSKESRNFSFWEKLDMFFLERADILFIYTLPLWEQSIGIQQEHNKINELGKPVIFIPCGYNNNTELLKVFPVKAFAES